MLIECNGEIITETCKSSISQKPPIKVAYVEVTIGDVVYLINEHPDGLEISSHGSPLKISLNSNDSILISKI